MSKVFIKTLNSLVDALDLAEELDAHDIKYEVVCDGVEVDEKDAKIVEDILLQLEQQALEDEEE